MLPASGLQVQVASKCCKVACCTAGENIFPSGYLDLIGPNPEDRSVSKRNWEARIQSWRCELLAASCLFRGISV